ncbi:MAG: HDOD domain-containing protein [Candidatus Gastranaerophilales bacterium]|nr:HDOD domain-containing protein [Candidatus Gastranaerophilales bacterium]
MNLEEFIIEPYQIPSMPQVIVKALNIIKDEDSGVKELADIISYDQALTTQILKLVNSAYYGFSQQIVSISKAISLLGMSQAKNIIITVAMKSVLTSNGGKELWQHSLRCGIACEYLAKEFKLMSPDEAFILGFLHDIGKILLNKKSPKLYAKAVEIADRGLNVVEAEEIFFKTNHAEVGFYLASKWKLSIIIANAIKYHHDPLKSSMSNVASLVYFADTMIQPNFKKPYFDQQIERRTNIYIDDPMECKQIIEEKANLLMSELIK